MIGVLEVLVTWLVTSQPLAGSLKVASMNVNSSVGVSGALLQSLAPPPPQQYMIPKVAVAVV